MRRLGIILRVIGAIMILATMLSEVLLVQTKDPAFVQKYHYLLLALGLLLYVLGMALMKSKPKSDLKVVPRE